jgi:hypothetical protein
MNKKIDERTRLQAITVIATGSMVILVAGKRLVNLEFGVFLAIVAFVAICLSLPEGRE